MPPKRKTSQPPQRSSDRLRTKMTIATATATATENIQIDLSTPTPPPVKKTKTTKKKRPTSSGPEQKAQEEEQDSATTPIRHIFCVKNEDDVRRYEELDDCFILGFDPNSPMVIGNLAGKAAAAESPDVAVVAEKGKVACRDYPHSRHLCVKFPFESTPHEKYCELCHCYVCDVAAPCKSWSIPSTDSHCNASEKIGVWKRERTFRQQLSSYCKQ